MEKRHTLKVTFFKDTMMLVLNVVVAGSAARRRTCGRLCYRVGETCAAPAYEQFDAVGSTVNARHCGRGQRGH